MKAALRSVVPLAFAVALWGLAGAARSESYPSKPVRVVVPNSAGGPSDLVGRVLAQKLAEIWGQSVVVENRAGAGGNIGVDAVVKAPPDGYTLLVTNSAPIVVNQSLYASVPYNAQSDLSAVRVIASAPQILVVPAASELDSVVKLIHAAHAHPGALTFASLGIGTAPHLAGELFKSQAALDIVHVPYRSVPQVYGALMTDEVSMFFDVPTVLSQVRAGKMKALAVTSRTRYGLAPELPTMMESGLPDYEMGSWYGLMAPAGIGREVLARLQTDTAQALADAEVRSKFRAIGFEVVGGTPQDFESLIRAESARWAKLISASGMRAN